MKKMIPDGAEVEYLTIDGKNKEYWEKVIFKLMHPLYGKYPHVIGNLGAIMPLAWNNYKIRYKGTIFEG